MTEITASENLSKAPEQTYALTVQLQPKESMVKKTSLPPPPPHVFIKLTHNCWLQNFPFAVSKMIASVGFKRGPVSPGDHVHVLNFQNSPWQTP